MAVREIELSMAVISIDVFQAGFGQGLTHVVHVQPENTGR
jgi:hypothetical protein